MRARASTNLQFIFFFFFRFSRALLQSEGKWKVEDEGTSHPLGSRFLGQFFLVWSQTGLTLINRSGQCCMLKKVSDVSSLFPLGHSDACVAMYKAVPNAFQHRVPYLLYFEPGATYTSALYLGYLRLVLAESFSDELHNWYIWDFFFFFLLMVMSADWCRQRSALH